MRRLPVSKLAVALAALGLLAACVADGRDYRGHGARGGERVAIPVDHLPPPGACRIWLPDRPPSNQPPSGPCRQLLRHVPPGAVLVHG
jgi:hypothetical protein